MLPLNTNNPEKIKTLESVPVVDASKRTRKLLIAIAVVLGVAALVVYVSGIQFPWITDSAK